MSRKNSRQAVLDNEYLSYDKNPGINLTSFNKCWKEGRKGWVTDDWTDDDWAKMMGLWEHLLQNCMKEVKADRSLTVRLGSGGYVTRERWEKDKAAKGFSRALEIVVEQLDGIDETEHRDLLRMIYERVGVMRTVIEEAGLASTRRGLK